MEVERTVSVSKNLMESGASDPESLGNSSERPFVPGNPISKIANAAFWGKTQSNRVGQFPRIEKSRLVAAVPRFLAMVTE
jgi:hypothetical protein